MHRTTEVKEIMTKDVIAAHPTDTVASIREKFDQHKIHHMPVVQNGKVEGMISMNDIHSLEHQFTIFNNPEAELNNRKVFMTMLAKDIMKSPVIKVNETDPVAKAVNLFLENLFHGLPVVNEGDKLVGMITTLDVIRHALEPSR